MLFAVRHRIAATLTTRHAARNNPLPYHLSSLRRPALNTTRLTQGSDRSASVIAFIASPIRAPASAGLARSLSARDMLASGSQSRARTQSTPSEVRGARTKLLEEQLEEEIVIWEGPALSFSPFARKRYVHRVKSHG